jgi:endonuclease YncB( thermonuclease family)
VPIKMYSPLTVTDIHDGDTLTVRVEMGLETQRTINVRLYAASAPELDEDGGDAATEALRGWLGAAQEPLTLVTVLTRTGNQRMTLGRYLGDIVDADGSSLCAFVRERQENAR